MVKSFYRDSVRVDALTAAPCGTSASRLTRPEPPNLNSTEQKQKVLSSRLELETFIPVS